MGQYAYLPDQHEAVASQPFLFAGRTFLRGEPFPWRELNGGKPLPETDLRGLYLADLVDFLPPGEVMPPRLHDTPIARRLGMTMEKQNHANALAVKEDERPKQVVDPDELDSESDLADMAKFVSKKAPTTPKQAKVDAMSKAREQRQPAKPPAAKPREESVIDDPAQIDAILKRGSGE